MLEIEEIKIENLIYEMRGKQVMLDSDVAKLFGYETKQLNRQVIRNENRFPENYCFQLNEDEYNSLRCHFGTLKRGRGEHRKYLPFVFTEHGIVMLAGLLKSDVAVSMSFKIVNAFVKLRHFVSENKDIFKRLTTVEYEIIECKDGILLKIKQNKYKKNIFKDKFYLIIDGINLFGDIFIS